MTDQKRQALIDLYQQLETSRIPYSHNFLRCVAHSQQALQAILQSSNEQTLNQMLAGTRNSLKNSVEITLEKALQDNNTNAPYQLSVIESSIDSIDTVLGTTIVPFDQEIRDIYTLIGQPTNERARFCNEAGINQKFHAYGITNGAQFTVLQNNPALVERFLRLCEATGCSPTVVASFREVLLPNTRINQINSPQTRVAVIAAMRQDPVFEETITNRAYSRANDRQLLLSYLDGLRDDVTNAEHGRYREGLYDTYYLPFLQRTGRTQNQNWHQNKADFFSSVECQRYIDEIIRPDFDRFNRITNLGNRNAGIYQNGGRLIGNGDASGVEFSPTSDSIEIKQNPRASFDVNSNENHTLKTIDVRDDTNTSLGSFRTGEKVPLEVLRRADRVVGTVGVQPQVSMKSILNNATVAFESPEQNVTVEMDRNQINNLLASVEPVAPIAPRASLVVGGPNPSVPITTDNIVLSGTGEAGRDVEVSVGGVALPVVTVEPDGSWQVPVTGLTVGPVNIQTRMRDTAGTGWEPSVNRLYTCTFAPATPTLPDFPSFTAPGHNVFGPSPVTLKGRLVQGKYVQVQTWDGASWINVGGRLTPEQTSKDREFPVGRLNPGAYRYRAVPCLDDGTLHPARATENRFEVGYLTMTNFANPNRNTVSIDVTGEVTKPMILRLRKKNADGNRDSYDEKWKQPLTSTPQTITLTDLGLTHGEREIQSEQNGDKLHHNFTIEPMPIAVDMTRLPTSQQRNPVFYGTAEPGENVEVFYKKPGSKPTDPVLKIKTQANSRGEWNFVLDETIQGTYDLEVRCAGEKETIRYVSEGVSRAPKLDNAKISVREDKDFTVSGYINRNELDCESVGIFRTVEVQGQLKQEEITRIPLGAGQSRRNIRTRNSSRDSSFKHTLPASLIKEYDIPETLIVKPIKHGGDIDEVNVSTLQVTKTQDMRNAPREALKQVGIQFDEVGTSDNASVLLKGKVTQNKDTKYPVEKVAIWRDTRGVSNKLVKRDYVEVGVDSEGNWQLPKLFTNNGKYKYHAAPILRAEPLGGTLFRNTKKVLGESTFIDFEVQSEVNAGRSKRYNPLSRKMPWSKKKKEGKEGSGAGAGSGGSGGESGGEGGGSSGGGGGLFSRTRQWWKRAFFEEDAMERQYKKWTAKPA